MIVKIDNKIETPQDYADARTLGLYNVSAEDATRFRIDVDLPVEKDDWQIGVVVGPSGSGKTSIARALSKQGWMEWYPVFGRGSIISELTAKDSYERATASLSAVGLGSVPSWLRSYGVLSNGEQFRAGLAGLLLDTSGGGGAALRQAASIYIDEFTSILDRQVAKVGAGAFAKAWRRKPDRRVILITPHYDILEWVTPDWWIDTAHGLDQFAEDRGVVVAQKGDFQEAADRTRYQGNEVATLAC